MPLFDTDLEWYLSATGASAGGAISATPIVSGVDNNLWPDLNTGELAAGGTRYKKIFIANESGADDWLAPVLWLSLEATNIDEHIGLGFDDTSDDENTAGSLTAWGATELLEAVSDGADTRTLSIYGVNDVGDPLREDIVLNGTTPVPSTEDWQTVYACHLGASSGTRTVTLKEGAGGTTRGTIPPNFTAIWLWVEAISKPTGIQLPNLGAGENYGIWRRQVWAPGAGGVRPNDNRIKGQEA